jgi:branched-chain amino acid transport system permease protein
MMQRKASWGLTGALFGALLILSFWLFTPVATWLSPAVPWMAALMSPLLGQWIPVEAITNIVIQLLAAAILYVPIAYAFYWVAGALGRRFDFRSSDLTVLGIGMMLTMGMLAPYVLYPVFVMKVLCFALFACAFNLLIGFVGLLSFGHAAYFGAAGYISGHLAKVWGWPPELAILASAAVAALLGAVFGGIAIRRQGIYFAMITLALAQMVYFFALQAKFTGGEDGIQAIPRGHLLGFIDLGHPLAMYYTVFAICLGGFLLIYRTVHSPFGQVLKAIRENEARAISLGYSVDRYKLVAFVLSAGLAGLAGGTKAIVFQLASLTDVHWSMSGEVVLMTLLGGIGTVFGPIVGAALQEWIENSFAATGAWVTIITGLIFVICVLAFRRGIVGELRRWLERRMAAAAAEPRVRARQSAPHARTEA